MSRPATRFRERHYFELFRAHFLVPSGEPEYGDKPDVIIRGPTTIGIEISNLYLMPGADPTSEQVQRERRLKVLAEAQRLHEAAGGRRIEVSVDFQPTHPIANVEATARSLADLAASAAGFPAGMLAPNLVALCPQARSVYYNPIEYSDAKWRATQCYTVPSLSPTKVRDVVASKSSKLAAYVPCDTYWLLLVVDFFDTAQDQELHWPEGTLSLVSPYERVLIYKPQFGHVLEVPQ